MAKIELDEGARLRNSKIAVSGHCCCQAVGALSEFKVIREVQFHKLLKFGYITTSPTPPRSTPSSLNSFTHTHTYLKYYAVTVGLVFGVCVCATPLPLTSRF